jgi:hypothetical protein
MAAKADAAGLPKATASAKILVFMGSPPRQNRHTGRTP